MVRGGGPVKQMEILREYCRSVKLEKGEYLFRQGDPVDGIYFLQNGRLAVRAETEFENRTQVIALLDPGAPIGRLEGVNDTRRGLSVIALETADLIHLSLEAYHRMESEKPQLALNLLKKLLVVTNIRLLECSKRLACVL